MAFDNIHMETPALATAANRAGDVNTSILDYEKQLSNIAEMVKNVWGGQAKVAFDAKHQEIVGNLGNNAADVLNISEGTRTSQQIGTSADLDAGRIIAAINATH
jgi:uncharacterized protein YukE